MESCTLSCKLESDQTLRLWMQISSNLRVIWFVRREASLPLHDTIKWEYENRAAHQMSQQMKERQKRHLFRLYRMLFFDVKEPYPFLTIRKKSVAKNSIATVYFFLFFSFLSGHGNWRVPSTLAEWPLGEYQDLSSRLLGEPEELSSREQIQTS